MAAASPRWGAAFGIVAGVVVAVALSAAGLPHRPSTTEVQPRTDEAAAFLAAWARSRSVTYSAETTLVRVVDGQPTLSTDGFVARRPPQWVQRQGATWTGVIAGQRVECDNAVNGRTRCVGLEHNVDPAADVAAELDAFRSWLVAPASYAVGLDGGCFVMTRRAPVKAPPLGDTARYCFDANGVPTSTEITTGTISDRQTFSQQRLTVADSDLRLPAPLTSG